MGRLVLLVAATALLGCGMTDVVVDAGQDAAAPAADDAGSDLDAGQQDVDAGKPCQKPSDCAPDEYCTVCEWPNTGTCEPRPQDCNAAVDPVCGCDRVLYPSGCEARAAGVTTTLANLCTPPPGWIDCETHYCSGADSYCQDIHGNGMVPHCVPLPGSCVGRTDCACFGDAGGCGSCSYADAGFTWSCHID